MPHGHFFSSLRTSHLPLMGSVLVVNTWNKHKKRKSPQKFSKNPTYHDAKFRITKKRSYSFLKKTPAIFLLVQAKLIYCRSKEYFEDYLSTENNRRNSDDRVPLLSSEKGERLQMLSKNMPSTHLLLSSKQKPTSQEQQ